MGDASPDYWKKKREETDSRRAGDKPKTREAGVMGLRGRYVGYGMSPMNTTAKVCSVYLVTTVLAV